MRMPAPNLRDASSGEMQGVPRDTWRQPSFKGLQAAFLSPLAAGHSLMYFCWALSHLELPPGVELVSNKSKRLIPRRHRRQTGAEPGWPLLVPRQDY